MDASEDLRLGSAAARGTPCLFRSMIAYRPIHAYMPGLPIMSKISSIGADVELF